MLWIETLHSPAALLMLFGGVLVIDITVWLGHEMRKREQHFVDTLMDILGSWVSLGLMGVVTVGWALWDFTGHKPDDLLDIVISIWTMLLDVMVIIGYNYSHHQDRKQLREDRERMQDIHAMLKKLTDDRA